MNRQIAFLPARSPIAIVRLDDLSQAVPLARALLSGGIRTLEFTLTNRAALNAMEKVRATLDGEGILGIGTVLDAESARAALLAGAQFLVTPTLQGDVIEMGLRYSVPVVCGALTPTEILSAWQQGATLVKVFPAGRLGPGYLKDIAGPLPQIPLVPTGGINLDNCRAFLDAGAYTVAIGGSLVSPTLVASQDWHALTDLAARYVAACQ